jgi:mRNA interferase MazF
VAHAISVRLDEESERALRSLEAAGLSRSEAIRAALIDSARRLCRRSELDAEAAALEAFEDDREEMLAVAGLMESLRAPRGDIYALKLPKAVGHEQHRDRYGVVVQADELLRRSVVLVAPTSRIARSATFRPEIEVGGEATRVLVEQVSAVDVRRLGDLAGHVSREEMWGIDDALTPDLGLR